MRLDIDVSTMNIPVGESRTAAYIDTEASVNVCFAVRREIEKGRPVYYITFPETNAGGGSKSDMPEDENFTVNPLPVEEASLLFNLPACLPTLDEEDGAYCFGPLNLKQANLVSSIAYEEFFKRCAVSRKGALIDKLTGSLRRNLPASLASQQPAND